MYNISVIFVVLPNNFFTYPNMLVADLNIVITTPFTAVLMLSTYDFGNDIGKLVYTTSSGPLLPTPSI